MHGFRRITGIAATAAALLLGAACASTVSGAASFGQAKCEGETVKPSGSPYCFLVPGGFQKVDGAYLGNDKWVSGVGLDNDNLILTGVITNSKNADKLSDEALLKATDAYVGALRGLDLKSEKGVLSRVPAGRAVEYRGTGESDGGKTITLHFYYIYFRNAVLQLNCQSTTKTDEVEKGCAAVLPTIHLNAVDSQ